MFRINSKTKTLSLTKGDNAYIQVDIKTIDGNSYEIQKDDAIVLTVRKNAKSDIVFQETAVDGMISITPDDTNSLTPGSYFYDVQLTTGFGIVQTVVPISAFYIEEEVTY